MKQTNICRLSGDIINDQFVRRGSQIHNGGANSEVNGSESKVRLQLVNVK